MSRRMSRYQCAALVCLSPATLPSSVPDRRGPPVTKVAVDDCHSACRARTIDRPSGGYKHSGDQ